MPFGALWSQFSADWAHFLPTRANQNLMKPIISLFLWWLWQPFFGQVATLMATKLTTNMKINASMPCGVSISRTWHPWLIKAMFRPQSGLWWPWQPFFGQVATLMATKLTINMKINASMPCLVLKVVCGGHGGHFLAKWPPTLMATKVTTNMKIIASMPCGVSILRTWHPWLI